MCVSLDRLLLGVFVVSIVSGGFGGEHRGSAQAEVWGFRDFGFGGV